MPLAIALALWALRSVRVSIMAAALVTAALAVFSVAATRDFLTYQTATWQVAREAHAAGVPYDALDGGAAWTGYRLYELSYKKKAKLVLPKGLPKGPLVLSKHDVDAWWIPFYAPALREWVHARPSPFSTPWCGRVEYSSWLEREPTYIFLLRHRDAPPGGP